MMVGFGVSMRTKGPPAYPDRRCLHPVLGVSNFSNTRGVLRILRLTPEHHRKGSHPFLCLFPNVRQPDDRLMFLQPNLWCHEYKCFSKNLGLPVGMR